MLFACQNVLNLYGRDLRKAVDGLVGRVNGKYGKTDYCPIQYVKKKLHHRSAQEQTSLINKHIDNLVYADEV